MNATKLATSRILVIDDEPSLQQAYRTILCPRPAGNASLDAMDAALFGNPDSSTPTPTPARFELDVASQGQQGLAMLTAALAEGRPYGMVFVDMRMPPGWDGVETVENLWKVDPNLEVVICTAYSDHPWNKVVDRLGHTHRLLLLRKPFDAAEIWQLAESLSQKRNIESASRASQIALENANANLQREAAARQSVEGKLKYDSLTQLPNRVLLYERIEACIERAKRDPHFKFSALFLDVDDFKMINDTFGHAIGDYLLVEVGKRLNASLRSLDTALRSHKDTAARLSGDEFVILLDGVSATNDGQIVAERIQQLMSQPITIGGRDLNITVSLGCAMGSGDHLVPEDLLRDADAALYQAKADGKGQIRVFDESIRQSIMTRQRLTVDLQNPATLHQLRVMYQPIVSLESGLIESFEALLRWEHPELGAISPALFIPIAEESGRIHDLGLWVLRESCQQLRIWHERFPTRNDLTVSVNVSTKQLADLKFTDSVEQILKDVGLSGNFLNIEITESAFIDNMDTVCRQLATIRSMGINLHLDDFGTGYSSLSYFHTLPIDAVKIDRSFVSNMGLDGRVANIVQAIQIMATNRSLKVIAEGVETVEQLAQLQALGCTYGQGYLMSRPVDPVAAGNILLENERTRSLPIPQWPQAKAG